MTIEGDTLRYADFKSDKSSVLHGSNIERLEVTNRAQLEFVLKTKMSGPERGRSYSFRASTCATIQRGKCMCMQCRACHAYACTTSVRQKKTAARVLCACAYVRVCCAPVTCLLGYDAGALSLSIGRLVSCCGSARYRSARVTRKLRRRRRG